MHASQKIPVDRSNIFGMYLRITLHYFEDIFPISVLTFPEFSFMYTLYSLNTLASIRHTLQALNKVLLIFHSNYNRFYLSDKNNNQEMQLLKYNNATRKISI